MRSARKAIRNSVRFAALAVGLSLLTPIASAYYYWIYFAGRSGPYTPIPAKFDLSTLPNQSIPYLISSQGPAVMLPGDTFNALISQIRAAANVWNGVPTSAARLSFGGLSPMSQPDSSPEVDVVFDDNMAPGLLAYTRLTTVQDVSGTLARGAQFVPVLSARVQLHNDLTLFQPPFQQASWSDSFFLTIVHEFGHALGLQHTLTSSVMSTQLTAATTKALPLAADDIAGISLLYPNGTLSNVGSITGTVTLGGAAVNMASVVALSTSGTAVSALTNPDGTYRIDGIPSNAGPYYVYVHPLPPALTASGEAYPDNIVPAQDGNGGQFPASTGFGTQFYGGGTDWTASTPINVNAGQSTDGINFNVSARSGPAIYGVAAYSWLGPNGVAGYPALSGNAYVSSGPLQSGASYYILLTGNGLLVNNKVAPGLNVSVIGGSAQVTVAPAVFPIGSGYIFVTVKTATGIASYTPTALSMTLNGDVYVLPAAFSVVPSAPPAITSVSGSTDGNGNTIVSISGNNLNQNTKILFDGAPATGIQVNSDGSLVATAPPAVNGYQAVVEALSPDSQTSAQLIGSNTPPSFVYSGPSAPSISVNPALLAAGTDSQVDIVGVNTTFIDGQTVAGFGTSDIAVKQAWVVNPGLLRMNVSVSASAAVGLTTVSVASGLQLATLNASFQVTPANQSAITLRTPIVNQATGLPGVPVGGVAVINTSGFPFTATNSTLAGWTLMIANQPVPFTVGDRGQILAQIPSGLLTGPSVLQLIPANGTVVRPVLVQIDPPPPEIRSATNASGAPVTSVPAHAGGAASAAPTAVHPGDVLTIVVAGLADAFGNFPDASAIDVSAGGIDVTPPSLTSIGGPGTPCQLQFTLPSNLSSGSQTITVRLGTRVSAGFVVTVE